MEAADRLDEQLEAAGVDVLIDDRDQRPGVKFKDADLIGVPLRVVIGERGLKEGTIEVKWRHEADRAAPCRPRPPPTTSSTKSKPPAQLTNRSAPNAARRSASKGHAPWSPCSTQTAVSDARPADRVDDHGSAPDPCRDPRRAEPALASRPPRRMGRIPRRHRRVHRLDDGLPDLRNLGQAENGLQINGFSINDDKLAIIHEKFFEILVPSFSLTLSRLPFSLFFPLSSVYSEVSAMTAENLWLAVVGLGLTLTSFVLSVSLCAGIRSLRFGSVFWTSRAVTRAIAPVPLGGGVALWAATTGVPLAGIALALAARLAAGRSRAVSRRCSLSRTRTRWDSGIGNDCYVDRTGRRSLDARLEAQAGGANRARVSPCMERCRALPCSARSPPRVRRNRDGFLGRRTHQRVQLP